PRISREKAKRHAAAVPLPKRNFAVPESQVKEVVLPGTLPAPNNDSSAERHLSQASTSKRRITFLPPPASAPQPYSRSHRKRQNRKGRQSLLGGTLNPLVSALSESLGEPTPSQPPKRTLAVRAEERQKAEAKKKESSKIGQGKTKPLSEKARRKQIESEGLRARIVAQLPGFRAQPWAVIRQYAGEVIAQKEKP
ncbi:hypothetical protein TREMEDRAFT_57256, partial [Tremella mesenterica DSM 1558]|uniref:uncharacterized protein n=1 Tax=Tremella mesenterica (strain ATCC 24925 / CBS 8224 / DSM 1558 / NBRC 9311 / NRRL Y-6157 / RJB 2259-6 / UBC 559-6) TaxID=578456 RepID=UPI0003F48FE2